MTTPTPQHPQQPSHPAAQPTPQPWGDRDWSTYYAAVAGKPPRDTLLLALKLFESSAAAGTPHPAPPLALDLGAGEGRDTRELLRRGFAVLAIDPHPESIRLLAKDLPPNSEDRLTVVHAGTESLATALMTRPRFQQCSIVNASFSLPFIRPEKFASAWKSIRASIAPGGLFAAQFFGPRDTWATIPGRTHHTREQVEQMLAGLTIHQMDESDKDGVDAENNPKHWHVFHVVAERPRNS